MIKYVSIHIFNSVMTSTRRRALAKALSLAIYIKTHKPASVLKDMSYSQIGSFVGISRNTCKKRIDCLKRMGLVEERCIKGHRYFFFNKLRTEKVRNRHSDGYHYPKHSDIDISILDTDTISAIEKGLMALYIVKVQSNKERVKQLDKSKRHSKKLSTIKTASRICHRRSYDNFVDNGISYKYIASKLHCSYSTVTKVINYGTKHKYYKVIKTPAVFVEGPEIRYVEEIQYAGKTRSIHYRCGNKAYYQPANRFELPRSVQPSLKW